MRIVFLKFLSEYHQFVLYKLNLTLVGYPSRSSEAGGLLKDQFYCVNTSYPMDNMLNRSAQTGPPNVRKRRPVFPPAGRS